MPKLTDAERLILHNQYNILAHLDTKNREGYEAAADLMHLGYHEGSPLGQVLMWVADAVPAERLEFAEAVYRLFEDKPFYGFEDKNLNGYLELHGGYIDEGEPLSDDEYRAMLERRAA